MREALWPNASSEEHSRELRLILEGRAPVTMPLIILVAESSARTLAGFLEVDLRSHADGCNPSRPVGYVEGGTSLRIIAAKESAKNFSPPQKTGRATKVG